MAPPPERVSPSVARSLSALEVDSLRAIANGLPESWVVCVEPPFGQLSMTPFDQRLIRHRCYVASGKLQRIFHDSGTATL